MGKIVKPKTHELPRSIDRVSFVYLDQTSINVGGGSIIAWRQGVKLALPVSSVICLILGPGATITHDAIKLIGGAGTTIVWMGSDQSRFYAAGRALSTSSRMLEAQAKVVCDKRKRLACAKKMYGKRFPGVDASSKTTMDSLRGMEGARMRVLYQQESERTGVPWSRRLSLFDDIDLYSDQDAGTVVNRSLTIGNQILYAVLLGILNAVNMSPALGVIHCGRGDAFVFDLADLYKAEITIPVAFDVAGMGVDQDKWSEIDRLTRVRVREKIKNCGLLKRVIADLKDLFLGEGEEVIEGLPADELIWIDENGGLWDKDGVLPLNVNYSVIELDEVG